MPRRSTLAVAGAGGLAGLGLVASRRRRRGAQPPAPSLPEAPSGRVSSVLADDGVELHVEVHGAERPAVTVVLAHGYHQSSRLWAGQVVDVLAARDDVQVVTYDHRGHGRSGRTPRESASLEQLGRDLAQVLDDLVPPGPVVLAGHSMGGMTLMALAEQRPELYGDRVQAVAFVATSSGGLADVAFGLPRLAAAWAHRGLALHNERARRAEAAGRPRRLAPGTARTIFGPSASREDVRLVLEDMADCSAETVAFFHGTFLDHDRVEALRGIDVPALVIAGDRDLLCPLPHSRTIAEALPQAELVVLPGAAHMVQLERRADVSRHLLALVDLAARAADRPPATQAPATQAPATPDRHVDAPPAAVDVADPAPAADVPVTERSWS